MLKGLLKQLFAVLLLTFVTGILPAVTSSSDNEAHRSSALSGFPAHKIQFSGTAEAAELLPQKKYLKPEEAFIPSLTQDNDRVKITFEIADSYYLYQEKLKVEPRNCTIKKVTVPEGIPHDD